MMRVGEDGGDRMVIAAALDVTPEERSRLQAISRATAMPKRAVQQARGLLLAAEGKANNEIARRCSTTPDTVRRWRAKFAAGGVDSVGVIAPGRGRKPTVRLGCTADIVAETRTTIPNDGTNGWSTRSMAARHQVGKDTVNRIWREYGLRPWSARSFALLCDPTLSDRLVDVVGLAVDGGARIAIFCVKESARDIAEPARFTWPVPEGAFADAAADADLDALSGPWPRSVGTFRRRSDGRSDLFHAVSRIDKRVPAGLSIHAVVDTRSGSGDAGIKAITRSMRRWNVHVTPDTPTWSVLVKPWLEALGRRRSADGQPTNVELMTASGEAWAESAGRAVRQASASGRAIPPLLWVAPSVGASAPADVVSLTGDSPLVVTSFVDAGSANRDGELASVR